MYMGHQCFIPPSIDRPTALIRPDQWICFKPHKTLVGRAPLVVEGSLSAGEGNNNLAVVEGNWPLVVEGNLAAGEDNQPLVLKPVGMTQ